MKFLIKSFINSPTVTIFCIIFILSAPFTVWYLWDDYNNSVCTDKYLFINPRFACLNARTIDKRGYIDLNSRLTDFIDKQKKEGSVNTVSIFFRDLEYGPTMGINEREDFVPASLLKLPNVLIILRLQEEGEINIFKKKLFYSDSEDNLKPSTRFVTASGIVPNTPYGVDELIFKSLVYSDNLANRLLIEYIKSIDNNRNLLLEIYRDLGILEVNDLITSAVNTKGYSTIFRMLYNSSFLNSEYSEKLLDIMSKSVSTGGLQDGLPKNIKISHKFGERILGKDENQLHDCGIIYYPTNPYLLCVMTKGKDLEKLQDIITYISKEVYKEFDSRKINN